MVGFVLLEEQKKLVRELERSNSDAQSLVSIGKSAMSINSTSETPALQCHQIKYVSFHFLQRY